MYTCAWACEMPAIENYKKAASFCKLQESTILVFSGLTVFMFSMIKWAYPSGNGLNKFDGCYTCPYHVEIVLNKQPLSVAIPFFWQKPISVIIALTKKEQEHK